MHHRLTAVLAALMLLGATSPARGDATGVRSKDISPVELANAVHAIRAGDTGAPRRPRIRTGHHPRRRTHGAVGAHGARVGGVGRDRPRVERLRRSRQSCISQRRRSRATCGRSIDSWDCGIEPRPSCFSWSATHGWWPDRSAHRIRTTGRNAARRLPASLPGAVCQRANA